jgi:hypothetical protein
MMRDGGLIDPHLLSDLGVGFADIGARPHEPGEIERRQPMALLVLGDLGVGVMCLRADDDRDYLEPRPFRRAAALGAEEDAVATVICGGAHNDGLKNPTQSDVLGKLGDLFLRELGPRVAWVFIEAVDRHEERQPFGSKCVERECLRGAEASVSTSSSPGPVIRLSSGSAFAS